MADNDFTRPMTDADITPPTATQFTPAVPLKDAGVEFESAMDDMGDDMGDDTFGSKTDGPAKSLKDTGTELTAKAGDKARGFAEMGKERAGGALDQLASMLTDAAGQVDGKLGAQYGQYARSAAEQVQGFSSAVKEKDMDELMDDARALVRKSPAIAIGAAAAIGFVVSRLIQSGLDAGTGASSGVGTGTRGTSGSDRV